MWCPFVHGINFKKAPASKSTYKAVNFIKTVVVGEMEEKGQHVQSLGTI